MWKTQYCFVFSPLWIHELISLKRKYLFHAGKISIVWRQIEDAFHRNFIFCCLRCWSSQTNVNKGGVLTRFRSRTFLPSCWGDKFRQFIQDLTRLTLPWQSDGLSTRIEPLGFSSSNWSVNYELVWMSDNFILRQRRKHWRRQPNAGNSEFSFSFSFQRFT